MKKNPLTFVLFLFALLYTSSSFAMPDESRAYDGLLYDYKDLNRKVYEQISADDRENEHQIGRLTNFIEMISQCGSLEGDFIEFGTWNGFSLMWIAHIAEQNGLYSKKIIGLDGFIGLPYSEGYFVKGTFNTTYEQCLSNITNNSRAYPNNLKNIQIGNFLFNEKQRIADYLQTLQARKFCFIHIDCDVSQSALEIFDLLLEKELIADKAFVAFDDFYCVSHLSQTMQNLFVSLSNKWEIIPYSRTHLTQNFLFKKR